MAVYLCTTYIQCALNFSLSLQPQPVSSRGIVPLSPLPPPTPPCQCRRPLPPSGSSTASPDHYDVVFVFVVAANSVRTFSVRHEAPANDVARVDRVLPPLLLLDSPPLPVKHIHELSYAISHQKNRERRVKRLLLQRVVVLFFMVLELDREGA